MPQTCPKIVMPHVMPQNCPHVMPQTLPKGYAHVIKENIPLHMGLVEQYELWSKRDPMTAELMIEY